MNESDPKIPEGLGEPLPGFNPEVTKRIQDAEIEGGVDLSKLKVGDRIEVRTRNTTYKIEKLAGENEYYISGNPEFCPAPTLAIIYGSNFGGSMLTLNKILRGSHLEYIIDVDGKKETVGTSMVREIKQLSPDEK